MTWHQYSGWEYVLRHTDIQPRRLSSSSVGAYSSWMTEMSRLERSVRKHLHPNWWKFQDNAIRQSRQDAVHRCAVCFFRCPHHNDTSSCLLQVRQQKEGFHRVILHQSSVMWRKRQVEAKQKRRMWLNQIWRHWVMTTSMNILQFGLWETWTAGRLLS